MRFDMDHLRRARGVYHVQVQVPRALRGVIGKATIIKSTRTKVAAEAARRKVAILAEIDRGFQEAATRVKHGPMVGINLPVQIDFAGLGFLAGHMQKHGDDTPIPPDLLQWIIPALRQLADTAGAGGGSSGGGSGGAGSRSDAEPLTFRRIVDAWAVETGKLRPGGKPNRSHQQRLHKMEVLAEYLGHDDVLRVSEDDLQGFVDNVLIARMARGEIKSTTIRDWLIDLKATFAFAHQRNKRRMPVNPAAGLRFRGNGAGRDARVAFTPDDLRTMLRASRHAEPGIKWPIWIAAFSGCRLAEIVEASTEDFYTVKEGVVFRIRLDNRPVEQRLKHEVSVRNIVLHSAVIAEGFMQFVESVRAKYGSGPLFPMCNMDKFGRRNALASNAIGKWIRGVGIDDTKKVFNCFRKTVRTQLTEAGVDPDRSRYIVGHAARDIDARVYLDHGIAAIAKAISLIPNPLDTEQ